ncbi:MAG: SRPBCC family protein [Polyangiaceae bacterium]
MVRNTDRIEKTIVLHAPHERIWRAITDSKEFGAWFGVDFEGPFVAGKRLHGRIVPTQVDAEVAKMQEPYAGMPFRCLIERVEPMHHFSFRWHPHDVDPKAPASTEAMTLVEFELRPVSDGIELKITESGFDQNPARASRQGLYQQRRGVDDSNQTHRSISIHEGCGNESRRAHSVMIVWFARSSFPPSRSRKRHRCLPHWATKRALRSLPSCATRAHNPSCA